MPVDPKEAGDKVQAIGGIHRQQGQVKEVKDENRAGDRVVEKTSRVEEEQLRWFPGGCRFES